MDNEVYYVITWTQHGDLMTFTPRLQDNFHCLTLWIDSLSYLAEECSDNCLFNCGRLVARQATYNGVV